MELYWHRRIYSFGVFNFIEGEHKSKSDVNATVNFNINPFPNK